MEIHKPKPVHSWRELLTEIGVVVVGVCIALAAEQAVEYFHWRAQVREAREVIATELASSLGGAHIRVQTRGCTESRLDQLAQILDAATKTGSLPPVGDIGTPPRSIWPTGAWDSAVASQTVTHFPRQQLADMASIYKFIQRIEEFSNREVEAWNELHSMSGPGRRLDPASEAELRKALSNARATVRIIASLSLQLAGLSKRLHLSFSPEDQRVIAAGSMPAGKYYICQPIGPAPAFYGQAPRFNPGNLPIGEFPDFSEDAR